MIARQTISDIDKVLASLSEEERELFHRIYHMVVSTGRLRVPETMKPWVTKTFQSVEAVETQRIVRITNRYTLEGSLFNLLRSLRPMPPKMPENEEWLAINPSDAFESPLQSTPEDTFGRVAGRYGVTAANMAKYDAVHSLVVFQRHNPLHFNKEELHDYLETALKWLSRAQAQHPNATHPFIMWNCLWKAGASILHGHLQIMLAEGLPYSEVERLRRASETYFKEWQRPYFQDLYEVHKTMGCATERDGVRLLAYLTPVKEREVVLLHDSLGPTLHHTLYQVLSLLIHTLGVMAFNLAIFMPPRKKDSLYWNGFPVVVRIVDRGDPWNRTCDIGGMELYGQSVVSSDPFQLARQLKESLHG